ncbi:unnamed protein product [Ectocarpus sp. 8 AP-2014]
MRSYQPRREAADYKKKVILSAQLTQRRLSLPIGPVWTYVSAECGEDGQNSFRHKGGNINTRAIQHVHTGCDIAQAACALQTSRCSNNQQRCITHPGTPPQQQYQSSTLFPRSLSLSLRLLLSLSSIERTSARSHLINETF